MALYINYLFFVHYMIIFPEEKPKKMTTEPTEGRYMWNLKINYNKTKYMGIGNK